ncbi:MAG: indole-3-glycerol phosphate synthase TrpC [Acidimicrobiia bacterium]|nr:indole-3-glycerol phosphate synthase TrpC [Acidimicrobiia bacterium]NNL69502.1 indole-3-glycerol phosphate synthase TrpC [Acidimicrobiia bacterium]RZV44219.1 MAG: indole-3-glycerol phosphate synthase TrpC [Acidimicrobiia bacterium]
MLDEILAATRVRVRALDLAEQRHLAVDQAPRLAARSLEAALTKPGINVIAEVKRRSPSRGELAPDLDPASQAAAYEAGGAAAISVLTEPEFFSGSLDDLTAVARSVGIPVLRKDFIIDLAQVWESKRAGADALLLIAAALDDELLANLLQEAHGAGLEALVEVHTAPEADRAMSAGARIIGVNNRDLATFTVDLATSESLAARVAAAPARVAESGIHRGADAARMGAAGYTAVLVGEALVRAHDPAALVAELRGVSR